VLEEVSSLSLKAWASAPASVEYFFKRRPLITEIFHIVLQPPDLCPNRNKVTGFCPIPNKMADPLAAIMTDLCFRLVFFSTRNHSLENTCANLSSFRICCVI
jgi:hypothetical protein